MKKMVLMAASVASMIDQFNLPNIRILLNLGYQVHIACNFQKGNTCDARRIRKLQRELERMHVICHQWDCPRKIRPVWACVRAYTQLGKLLDQYAFCFIHCQSPVGGALARLAAGRRKIRVIYTAHGFHFYKGAPWKSRLLYYPVEKLLAHGTDILVTINKEDDQFARKHLRAGRVCYIPGAGIDTKSFMGDCSKRTRRQFLEDCRLPEHAKVLLSVGELSERKNHLFMLSVLKNLNENVCYMICGQGELLTALQAYTHRRGLCHRVRFAGYQEDLREFYQYADLFVFPSLQEGLPVALMEAMASGLACVVSDIRGNRELIGRVSHKGSEKDLRNRIIQCGGMAVPGQRESFQKAVQTLLDDEALRKQCGKSNQRRICKYDQSVVDQKMMQIYADMYTNK